MIPTGASTGGDRGNEVSTIEMVEKRLLINDSMFNIKPEYMIMIYDYDDNDADDDYSYYYYYFLLSLLLLLLILILISI